MDWYSSSCNKRWRCCGDFDILWRVFFVLGPLLSPSNITASNITKNGTSAVLLIWDIGNEGSATNSGRHFSITCPSCMERKYRFTNVNTTANQIIIHNLMAYVSYTLKIRAFSEIAVLTQIDLSNNITFTTENGGSVSLLIYLFIRHSQYSY